jgi:uncharacterized protein YndB with AHSA1/START domain
MAAIVESIEIARRPEDVFAYLMDPSRMPEWQESAVSVRQEGEGPPQVGSRVAVTRRMGNQERTMTSELVEVDPPRKWAARGIDGPVRGMFTGTVEPLEGGDRSRATISLDFEGHGIGKLLVPLVVRRQVRAELPKNMQTLKQRLESGA